MIIVSYVLDIKHLTKTQSAMQQIGHEVFRRITQITYIDRTSRRSTGTTSGRWDPDYRAID